jgi:hypothetical protein
MARISTGSRLAFLAPHRVASRESIDRALVILPETKTATDATMLVNAAGSFIPKTFSEYDEALLSALPRAPGNYPWPLAFDVEPAFHPCTISTKETNLRRQFP